MSIHTESILEGSESTAEYRNCSARVKLLDNANVDNPNFDGAGHRITTRRLRASKLLLAAAHYNEW